MSNEKKISPAAGKGKRKNEPQQIFAELPGILISKIGKNDMFDVDNFLKAAKSERTIEEYFAENEAVVDAYGEALDTDPKYLVLKIKDSPTMLHAAMSLHFACWVIPGLTCYLMERCQDLLINGFAISDRFLGIAAGKRLQAPPAESK